MIVIPDSNSLVADFRMKGTRWRLLLEKLEETGHSLIVPEIVIQETVNKFREMLLKDIGVAEKRIARISDRIGEPIKSPIGQNEIDQYTERYDTFLRDSLTAAGATFAAFPEIRQGMGVRS